MEYGNQYRVGPWWYKAKKLGLTWVPGSSIGGMPLATSVRQQRCWIRTFAGVATSLTGTLNTYVPKGPPYGTSYLRGVVALVAQPQEVVAHAAIAG